jgi:hypothetical protein
VTSDRRRKKAIRERMAATGEPGLHNQWHDRKGLAARIRRALTWR